MTMKTTPETTATLRASCTGYRADIAAETLAALLDDLDTVIAERDLLERSAAAAERRTAEVVARLASVERERDKLAAVTSERDAHDCRAALLERTPPGTQLVYWTGREVVITGTPSAEGERHNNCDAMGCSSVSHVVERISVLRTDHAQTGDLRVALTAVAAERDRLRAESRRWYRADGGYEEMDPEEVTRRRVLAAGIVDTATSFAERYGECYLCDDYGNDHADGGGERHEEGCPVGAYLDGIGGAR